jgi:hypothetical protein
MSLMLRQIFSKYRRGWIATAKLHTGSDTNVCYKEIGFCRYETNLNLYTLEDFVNTSKLRTVGEKLKTFKKKIDTYGCEKEWVSRNQELCV